MMKDVWFLFLVLAIESLCLYFLWNIIMPVVFNTTTINLAQAFGIRILASVLFGRYNNNGTTD